MNMINTIIETIGEDFAFLSDKAKTFLKDIDNDDIDEFESQINIYILLTRDSEDEDDKFDIELLERLKINLELLRQHLD